MIAIGRVLGLDARWESRDAHAWVAPLAAGGLVAAALLALFGMPPVNLHSPLHFVGVMDPFCGMTRGVAATMRGDLPTALRFNPASPLVPLAGLAVVIRWVVGRRFGRWLTVSCRRTSVSITLAVVAIAALEVNQQLNASLLTA